MGAGSFRLSADHDYQLSNRVAYLHKLANEGVPSILMYLGWIGSPDWTTDPFTTGSAWEDAVKGHFARIGPADFIGPKQQLPSGTSLQIIVRSISPAVLQAPAPNEPA